jgi:hypothetical protein
MNKELKEAFAGPGIKVCMGACPCEYVQRATAVSSYRWFPREHGLTDSEKVKTVCKEVTEDQLQ